MDNSSLGIGFQTKQTLCRLLREGDISPHQQALFYKAVKAFFVQATEYLLKWCPFQEELLTHSTWLHFEDRLEKNFLSVEYFVMPYPAILHDVSIDLLNEQFFNYQLIEDKDIPVFVKECAGLAEEDPHRVDILWGYLKKVKKPGTNSFEYDQLFRVAEVVMSIPHSNAGEERIFSLVSKNKTPSRSSLKSDGTLSSLITIKTHIKDPKNWQPSKCFIEKAKKVTKIYDRHKSN